MKIIDAHLHLFSEDSAEEMARQVGHHNNVDHLREVYGELHIAHGVRNTAAGLRYVIYVFVTALDDPSKVIAEPSGFLIAPRDWERVGDVSNVVFTNGAIADEDGSVYIYYAASDTRLHVASTTIDKLLDFAFNTPADPLRSVDCVKQRCALIDKNLEYLKSIGE